VSNGAFFHDFNPFSMIHEIFIENEKNSSGGNKQSSCTSA